MRLIVLLIAFLYCFPAFADRPLTITPGGYWLTYIDGNGVPSFVKVDNVLDLRSSEQPKPPVEEPKPDAVPDTPVEPKPPVVPDFDLTLVKDSQAWAESIGDTDTSQAISAVYAHVGGAFEDGLVKPESIWQVLRVATNDAIKIADGKKDWKPFRDKLSDIVTLGLQQGTLADKKAVMRLINSVRQGLDQSADGSTAITIDKLIRIAASTNGAIDAN